MNKSDKTNKNITFISFNFSIVGENVFEENYFRVFLKIKKKFKGFYIL